MSDTIKIKPKYNFQYKPVRVCIPIGMACNLKCKYCMRYAGKIREPKGLSNLMVEFLKQLDPAQTEAVIINGGEPLLYQDRIKQVFDLVPKQIHKAVMTNGTLLTQEFIDYLNSIDGELHFSHEGLASKQLKGLDVLEDPKIVDLLNQVKIMRLYTIVTSYNPDVLANFEYIHKYINKVPKLWYTPFPMFSFTNANHDLHQQFDYDIYGRSLIELWRKYPNFVSRSEHHARYTRNNGFVITPTGDVCSLCTLRKYGTVLDTKDQLKTVAQSLGEYDQCDNTDCSMREYCVMAKQLADPFTCEAQRTHLKAINYLRSFNV